MAVFLGIESGFDHEGDPDVLAAFYRLGLRSIQFATQSGFNAFADSALAPTQGGQKPDHYNGINQRGRELVQRMNELGVLIDITHGTEAVHLQLIEASRAPVVASHDVIRAVSGVGLSDAVLKALAAKGGLVGIHGGAAVVGKRYRRWLAENPDCRSQCRQGRDRHGWFCTLAAAPGRKSWRRHRQNGCGVRRALEGARGLARGSCCRQRAADRGRVGRTGRLRHQDRGRRSRRTGSRSSGRPQRRASNAGGLSRLLAALRRITTEENVRKIAGENWLRVLAQAKVG
jgi:membrane dipeptidase